MKSPTFHVCHSNKYGVQFIISLICTHRSSVLGPQIHSCSTKNNKAVPAEMTVKYRKIKNINIDKCSSNVRNHYTDLHHERSLGQLLTN